jgi:DNA-binding response OmpR family regulator
VTSSARVLIADEPDVSKALQLLLKGEAYQTDTADSPAAVVRAVGRIIKLRDGFMEN